MNTVTALRPVSRDEQPLKHMRLYTAVSLIAVVGVFGVITILRAEGPGMMWLMAVTTGIAVEYTRHWERRPAWWLTAGALVITIGVWLYSAIVFYPFAAVFPAVVLGIVVSHHRRWPLTTAIGAVAMVAPVVVAGSIDPDGFNPMLLTTTIALYVAIVFLFLLNRYAFGLYLEIDAARRVSADLAVAEERYRFAADLHDIQGHTLHVIKLKTQLADKLIDRDPAAAREQLKEAQQLIAETLENTRNLAYGNRHVALASELANAEQLFAAAGIAWTVNGQTTLGPHDELFGLVVREATTNVLRHAQATTVSVDLAADRLVVTNDGSPSAARSLSGLARLGERFSTAGGALRTSSVDGTFTTEASFQ